MAKKTHAEHNREAEELWIAMQARDSNRMAQGRSFEVDELEWMLLTAELSFLSPWYYPNGGNC